jgi:NitT/TauT family transport system permease protein
MMNAAATLERAAIGFAIGAFSGFVLALLMKFSGIIEKIAFPYLMLIQMIPILGMAPIVFAITQDIGVSRIVISAILTFYPVAANTLAGLKSVSAEHENLFRSYSANIFQTYTKLYIPTSIPFMFTGLKISAPLAITASILVDTLQGGVGLGCLLSQSLKGGMSPFVFWQIIFLSAAIGILSLQVMVIAEKLLLSNKIKKKMRRFFAGGKAEA